MVVRDTQSAEALIKLWYVLLGSPANGNARAPNRMMAASIKLLRKSIHISSFPMKSSFCSLTPKIRDAGNKDRHYTFASSSDSLQIQCVAVVINLANAKRHNALDVPTLFARL